MEQQGKTWGIVPLTKTAYVSTFGFSKDDAPDKKLSISWAGKESDCGLKVEVVETSPEKMLSMATDVPKNGTFKLRTDQNHNTATDSFASILQQAVSEMCKRSNKGLSARARWGFAKFIGQPDDGISMGDPYGNEE